VKFKVEMRAVVVAEEMSGGSVTAVESIEAAGEPGAIVGGKIGAGSIISANIIGEVSGTLT
jgi:hypothetical protein